MSRGKKGDKDDNREDFNTKTGNFGGDLELEEKWDNGGESGKRKSKDKKVNEEGSILVECLEESDWSIFNGGVKGDEKGEYTYTGERGNTVIIDYVIGDEEMKERIGRLEKVDSDHHPLVVSIKGECAVTRKRVRGGEEEESKRRKERVEACLG